MLSQSKALAETFFNDEAEHKFLEKDRIPITPILFFHLKQGGAP